MAGAESLTEKGKTMRTYKCDGCKPVRAETMGDAAEIFAARMARRKYGKARGVVGAGPRLDSWAQDGSTGYYEAFIGYRCQTRHFEVSGGNVRFAVYAA